jgi:hypothetical protein
MGVLDDAIREHLDLKRQRGASDAEISRAEAEALGPARRSFTPEPDDDEPEHDLGETMVVEPMDDVAPPPAPPHAAEPTRVVHDIDEELAPPPPVTRAEVDDEPAEPPPGDDDSPVDEPPIDPPLGEEPGGQRRF